jgi:methylglutaconyl-CoA hydratase
MNKVEAVHRPDQLLALTIHRPEARNAFDHETVLALTHHLKAAAHDPEVRAVLLTGSGANFCAGGDIKWMQDILDSPVEHMARAAADISGMLQAAWALDKPLVVQLRGAVMGGGIGLVCCADIAIADSTALFGLGKVRLGIVPAAISPFVVRALGTRLATRLALLGEPFGPHQALQHGVIGEITTPADCDAAVERAIAALLRGGPQAQARTKALFRATPRDGDISYQRSIDCLVDTWRAPEAGEGLGAFVAKRRPVWVTTVGKATC